jgi:UDP-sulfoquinovose synthase
MRILMLGGDGYLGWPQSCYLSARGHEVLLVDNFLRRQMHLEIGCESLTPIAPMPARLEAWNRPLPQGGLPLRFTFGDLTDYPFVRGVFDEFKPDAVVHYGEQPSAPYSMIDRNHCVFTQENNVTSTLNVLWAMRECAPDCHLVKLGTLGEYGTPNIDIEEGYIEIEHKGRKDVLPFPKQPGSFYHLSKVHDSGNIMLACKIWGLTATDLNQGVVYGIDTVETATHPHLATRFDYNDVFGTVLNRFCVQAALGHPLTVYGGGGQRRGFINIRDTMRCVELAILNPPEPGRLRVFNQLTEVFSVADLADVVAEAAKRLEWSVRVDHLANPRVESEDHYYNPVHSALTALGLQPHLLSETLVESMLVKVRELSDAVDLRQILPRAKWRN